LQNSFLIPSGYFFSLLLYGLEENTISCAGNLCGIARFIFPTFNQEHLRSITQTILHRGPDTEGLFFATADQFNID